MRKPFTFAGGVTINAPQPGLTMGADNADGKTIAFIEVSWHKILGLIASAGVLPHEDDNLYLAFMVQHPGELVNKLFTWLRMLL